MDVAAEEVATFLIPNPVPPLPRGDGGATDARTDGGPTAGPRCTIPGITDIATFEKVFFQETGVAAAMKTRRCADAACHGGNYGPDFKGVMVGMRLITSKPPTYHCAGTGMRVIDVERPERSMLLWRLFLADKTAMCTSKDDSLLRRMPILRGKEDSGGDPNSVAMRLSQQELDCAYWYVLELAKVVTKNP